ncbi:transposase [Ruegeria atlantica]|uniref:transposase n=1 Tax=Ruegeria atlantica TaxID=81569 RepID=UPI0034A08B1F
MKTRFTDEQIIQMIKEQEAGEKTVDVCMVLWSRGWPHGQCNHCSVADRREHSYQAALRL